MKKLSLSIIGAALLAVVAFTSSTPSSNAQQRTQRHEIVMLYSYQGGSSTNGVFKYNGLQVYCSSSSEGAPKFPQASTGQKDGLIETAEAIAQLRSEGYSAIKISDNGMTVIMEK